MRRSYWVDAMFGLAIMGVLGGILIAKRRSVRQNPDGAVVERALLSFFEGRAWNKAWKAGEVIAVWPSFRRSNRADFGAQLRMLMEREADAAQVAVLRKVQGSIESENPLPVWPLPPLNSLRFDERLVFSESSPQWWMKGPSRISVGRGGKLSTVRAFCQVAPPCYSADERFGIVDTMVNWQRHSGNVTFVLERGIAGWHVVYTTVITYR